MTQVDFAIITIREDEFKAVLQRFPPKPQTGASGRIYSVTQVKTQDGQDCSVAVVRCPEQGLNIAQKVANDLIQDFDPQVLLVVGIAGGIPSEDFTLGDVIISSRIDNFSVGKRDEDDTETFAVTGGTDPAVAAIATSLSFYPAQFAHWSDSIEITRPTVDLSQFEKDTFEQKTTDSTNTTASKWYKNLKKYTKKHFSKPRDPLFTAGRIASSNSVVRNIDLLAQWLLDARNILAVEMEAAGVFQAAEGISQRYKVMAIRGISDIIGLERDDEWTKYACQTAAAFAYTFVTAGIIQPRITAPVVRPPASASSSVAQTSAQLSQTPGSKKVDGTGPINVFISYADEDEKFKKQLETHLALLRREGTINTWHSQQTTAGLTTGRDQEIADHINSAQIILLLVSPSFLASDQLYYNEMLHALNRQASGNIRVIPITVRYVAPGDPNKTPFQKIQGLPRNGKPIESWRSADEAWANIAQEIREVCKDLRQES